MSKMSASYKSSISAFLITSVLALTISCAERVDEPGRAQRVLEHAYSQYQGGRYASAWKSFIDTMYYLQETKQRSQAAYVLASALCVHAYQRSPVRGTDHRCISFSIGDSDPREVDTSGEMLQTSLNYLTAANLIAPSARVQKAMDCHTSLLNNAAADCDLIDEGLLGDLLGGD